MSTRRPATTERAAAGLSSPSSLSRSPAPSPSPTRDGRLLRGERARGAVVDALLALIEEGDLLPTGPRIAERAGVSVRLVFHHFRDLEDLFFATSKRQLERILPSLQKVPSSGSLAERLDAFAAARARLLEQIAPVRRAALLRAPFSKVLTERIAEVRAWKRTELEEVFGSELAAVEPPARSVLCDALAATASFSFWNELRQGQGLDAEAARGVLRHALAALLAPRR